jgi:hypothetical protein
MLVAFAICVSASRIVSLRVSCDHAGSAQTQPSASPLESGRYRKSMEIKNCRIGSLSAEFNENEGFIET